MGYNQARGDSLNVSSAPLAAVSAGGDAVPIWKDPEMLALGAELGRYLLLALAFAFVCWPSRSSILALSARSSRTSRRRHRPRPPRKPRTPLPRKTTKT